MAKEESSYFWDQDNEFQLPDFCPSCREVLSCEEINAGNDVGNFKEIVLDIKEFKEVVARNKLEGLEKSTQFIYSKHEGYQNKKNPRQTPPDKTFFSEIL